MSPAVSHFDPVAESSELFAMSALRQSFTPEGLLGEWLINHPDATNEAQFQATSQTVALQSASHPTIDAKGESALMLPDSTRLRILASVGRDEAKRLLDLTPEEQITDAERMLKALLAQEHVSTDRNDYAQMSTLLSASQRAIALGIQPPESPDLLTARIRRISFLNALGGTDLPRFIGRQRMLEALEEEWHAHDHGFRTIAIEGPGGMGKSLTVTRFIANLLDSERNPPRAVYHLDFDHVELQTALPSAIWRKLIRQTKDWCDAHVADDLEELAHRVSDSGDGHDAPSESSRSSQLGDKAYIARELAHTLGRKSPPRILLFVDSYEQVEGYDDVTAAAPREIARELTSAGATVLVIYASRSFRRSARRMDKHYQLKQFTVAEAVQYLAREASRAGLTISAHRARRIAQVTGRTPLALRIAIGLIEKGDLDERSWLASLDTAPDLVQALLYERLLRRLRNPELRKIATPGLLVRRLSEQIITEVLARPCQLDLTRTSATQLMSAAKEEGQLFTTRPDDPDALWHRADVRTAMLASVRRATSADTATAIHHRAIDYYAQAGDSLILRTEELYHRLSLDQPGTVPAERWSDEAGRALRPSLSEFPRPARAFLRARLGAATREGKTVHPLGPSSPAQSNRSDDAEFVSVERKVLLSNGPDADLLSFWRKGRDSLDNPLGGVFAAALVRMGRYDAMLKAAGFLRRLTAPADPKAAAAVLRVAAAFMEGSKKLLHSLKYWDTAVKFAAEAHDASGELAGLTGRLRATRKHGGDRFGSTVDQSQAIKLMQSQVDELHHQKVLAREAVAELGPKLLADHRGLLEAVLTDLISANEAFPSAARDPQRLAYLSEKFLGSPQNNSMRNLSSAALRALNSGTAQAVIDAMREEVDLALEKGAAEAHNKIALTS